MKHPSNENERQTREDTGMLPVWFEGENRVDGMSTCPPATCERSRSEKDSVDTLLKARKVDEVLMVKFWPTFRWMLNASVSSDVVSSARRWI